MFHDFSVDRLTLGSGRVSSKTLKEMRALDQGPKFGHGFNHVGINTFEEFITAFKDKGILMIELKVSTIKDTGMEEKAAAIIKKHHAYNTVYLSSFNPIVLYRLKKIDPRIHTVFIFMDSDWNQAQLKEPTPSDKVPLPWFLKNEIARRLIRNIIKPDALSINKEVDQQTLHRLVKKGCPVFLWTVDSAIDIRDSLNKKPYGLVSNEPLLAKTLRDQHGAH